MKLAIIATCSAPSVRKHSRANSSRRAPQISIVDVWAIAALFVQKTARNKGPSATGTRREFPGNTSPSNWPMTRAPPPGIPPAAPSFTMSNTSRKYGDRLHFLMISNSRVSRERALVLRSVISVSARPRGSAFANRIRRLAFWNGPHSGKISFPSSSCRLQRSADFQRCLQQLRMVGEKFLDFSRAVGLLGRSCRTCTTDDIVKALQFAPRPIGINEIGRISDAAISSRLRASPRHRACQTPNSSKGGETAIFIGEMPGIAPLLGRAAKRPCPLYVLSNTTKPISKFLGCFHADVCLVISAKSFSPLDSDFANRTPRPMIMW